MRLVKDDIQEAQIIEETTTAKQPISEFDLEGFLASKFDSITADNKSGVITELLILADLIENKQAFRAIQAANPEVLNRYFEHIDYQKLIADHGDKLQGPAKDVVKKAMTDYALPFAAGTAAGMLVAGFLK